MHLLVLFTRNLPPHSYKSSCNRRVPPLESSLIEITTDIMLEHGREQFSSSIHSAVYVNYLSGAGGHGELGVELTEREEGEISRLS